ncbi:hypothetical protein HCU74_14260 [Spongiibacter sp. KMU-166]|uniref:Uncharacterized protein n=1 Tax=Spongiibacter thalassae TaxID=2721624 RepID=A0ABX1GHE4_9GAMM|nr:replication-relaxation family protein [Spongiibacter thalassae]NKI18576.1 hypothetical protein [Spongiibacter thalassae]
MKFSDYDYHSAKARSGEKLGQMLRWLYRWEVSSVHALAELFGTKRSATYSTLARYEKFGLIDSFTMPNVCGRVYHLKKNGVSTARELFVGHKDEHLKTAYFPSKINRSHVVHDLLTQHIVLRLKSEHSQARFLTDRQLRLRQKFFLRQDYKIPDAVVHLGSHKKPHQVLIEVQESPLRSYHLELILSLYAESIIRGEIQGLVFASTKRNILEHARRIIDRGVRSFDYIDGRWHPINPTVRQGPLSLSMLGDSIVLYDLSHYAGRYYTHIIRG